MTDIDTEWFHRNAVTFDLFGANFYPWSYGELKRASNASTRFVSGETSGDKIKLVLRDVYKRYQMPIMITETSAKSGIKGRARWMVETLDTIRILRADGIPIVGDTWFPLFTMVDWAYRTGRRPFRDYLINLGLYDSTFDSKGILRRHKTPLVKRYQTYMAQTLPPIPNLKSLVSSL